MYETVLVGTDGSDEARAALAHAMELAEFHDAEVYALMVVERQPQQLAFGVSDVEDLNEAVTDVVDEIVAEYADRAIDVTGEVRRGKPASVLLEFAHDIDADLLVVGQRGAGQLEHALLGSTADRLARLTDLPLSIIPVPASN